MAANETQGGVETVLSAAGHAFGDKAGGTSGILWGLLLEGVGKGLGNTEAVTAKRLADAVQGSAQHLQGFSKAELGDKTMLDALFPFVDTLVGQVDAGASISEAWRSAADACRSAAEETASLGSEDRQGAAAGRAQRWHTGSGRDLARADRYRDRQRARRCGG